MKEEEEERKRRRRRRFVTSTNFIRGDRGKERNLRSTGEALQETKLGGGTLQRLRV